MTGRIELHTERELIMITEKYYQALIDEDYEKAFNTLFLMILRKISIRLMAIR